MNPIRKSLVGAAAVAGLTLLVAVGCGSDDAAEKATTGTTATTDAASVAGVTTTFSGQGARDEVPEVAITAREHAFDLPASFQAGIVRLALRNAGAEPHGALFARLNNGVTVDQLTAALAQGPEAALPLVALAGGFGNVQPGASDALTIDLPAGQYVVLDLNPGTAGVPNAAKGMITPFTITGPARDVAAPSVNGEVVLGDFRFIMPALQGGETALKVTNAGRQPHELILFKLNPGATLEDVLTFDERAGGPPPAEEAGGLLPVAGGMRAWITLDLQPGTYAAVCFIPDPATGQPHFALGMAHQFTVGPGTTGSHGERKQP